MRPIPGSNYPSRLSECFLDALIADPEISATLRRHLINRYEVVYGGKIKPSEKEAEPPPAFVAEVTVAEPPFRRLRVYAMDPSLAGHYETAPISEAVLKVRWEKLQPGPVGDYLEVIDQDTLDVEKTKTYQPVDLNDPLLLAQDGWAPSEGNPAFHQQMVYAVAMKTIEHFERAWGRPVLWRPLPNPEDSADDRKFVPRLKIYPHAFRQANAYYSPQQIALRFGYFDATAADPGLFVPGQRIHTCLSHDIIAHETTHAILDGMHSRFNEASNPDCLAFHEALADIVSLMQHFTIPEILVHAIRQTQGNLEAPTLLGSLAVQFGRARGQRGALREAIGTFDDQGRWTRLRPNPQDYQTIKTPHSRGALLVAAVFDAFLKIYQNRTADLLRLSTGGTGVLPAGAIHPDLVQRLAQEAAKAAGHVLNMCIRALDYIPPLDITFYEYLRGIITADLDLVSDDQFNYRIAFIEAFQQRGLYPYHPDPTALDTLSVDTLRWRGIDLTGIPKPVAKLFNQIVNPLKRYADACFYAASRRTLFQKTRNYRHILKTSIEKLIKSMPEVEAKKFAGLFGLDPQFSIDVHELRRSIRVGPSGAHIPQVIVALTQTRSIPNPEAGTPFQFGGGSTLVLDLSKSAVQYAIFKDIHSPSREKRTRDFLADAWADPLRQMMLLNRAEPFAALHAMINLEE